ncbi:MAG: protein kinase [Myxococcales bacterium]|nr:protein kinase [Myxococcales bacterium]
MGSNHMIPSKGDVLGDKYLVEELLGQGGMGVVLAARNQRTNRRVAIKWLLPELMHNEAAVKRFEREARVAGSIDHPNVVNVYDVEQDGRTSYIVMEYLDGESLAEYLAHGQPLALPQAAAIFLPILRGVAAAHAAGVVHRDLKPENVFLCRPGDGVELVPKVLDFGISKINEKDSSQQATTITQEGSLLGTIQYMAPEQLRGQEADYRTDVYALGVMLYRMLSAQMPFCGNNHVDLALNIASNRPAPLSKHVEGVSAELDAVVSKALAQAADDRFATVERFGQALDACLGGRAPQHQPALAQPSTSRPAVGAATFEATPFAAEAQVVESALPFPAKRWGLVLALLAVGAVMVAGLLLMSRSSDTDASPVPAAATQPPALPEEASEQAVGGREETAAPDAPAPFAGAEEGWIAPAEVPQAPAAAEPASAEDPTSTEPTAQAPEAQKQPESPKRQQPRYRARREPARRERRESQAKARAPEGEAAPAQPDSTRSGPNRLGIKLDSDEF